MSIYMMKQKIRRREVMGGDLETPGIHLPPPLLPGMSVPPPLNVRFQGLMMYLKHFGF